MESLLGFEGTASANYFKLFGKMIKSPWIFNGRNRRPPKDEVNAVLSFGYVIVGSQIQALLDGVGFDPYLGFYHSVHYGRPSLSLDLLEEFRHSFIDRLAITLFNHHILSKNDFYQPPNGGIYLNTQGKKIFFTHFEKMLGKFTGATNVQLNKSSIRSVYQKQVNKLAKAVQTNVNYAPWTG